MRLNLGVTFVNGLTCERSDIDDQTFEATLKKYIFINTHVYNDTHMYTFCAYCL